MTPETDKQFVERMIAETPVLHSLNTERLLALALRGAETQWRPTREAKTDEVLLLRDKFGITHVRTINGLSGKWFTHFIPLTAFGEPKP